MLVEILLFVVGFVVLIKGADWLVGSASGIARRYGISELGIGLTIVAFGTSLPELVVNAFAAYNGHSDITFGNVIGSNLFNLLAILGVVGIIAPIRVSSSTVWKEIPLSLLAALLMLLLANAIGSAEAELTRLDGAVLLGGFGVFLFYVYRQLRRETPTQEPGEHAKAGTSTWVKLAIGLVLLVAGGRLVVYNAVEIATQMGISQTVTGLTIIAAGTSLPELATSVVAALKKNSDIAVGNIIGSNIFNLFFILGISSVIRPLSYSTDFNNDTYLLIGGTVVLFIAMFTGKARQLDRWEAVVLLAVYLGYTAYLVNQAV